MSGATRRTVLAWAPAVAAFGVAGRAAATPAPDRWQELREGFRWFAPAVVQAMEHARAAGMDPETLYCVLLPNRDSGSVLFSYDVAQPDGSTRMVSRSFDSRGEC
jgi:hypothetical protein